MQNLAQLSPLPLRLAFGMGFVHHGWHHVFFVNQRIANEWVLSSIGVPSPAVAGMCISAISFVCGIALILGVRVRAAAIVLTIMTWFAMVSVSIGNGFDFMHVLRATDTGPHLGFPGYEVPVLYLAGLLSLVASGAGPLRVTGYGLRVTENGISVRNP